MAFNYRLAQIQGMIVYLLLKLCLVMSLRKQFAKIIKQLFLLTNPIFRICYNDDVQGKSQKLGYASILHHPQELSFYGTYTCDSLLLL